MALPLIALIVGAFATLTMLTKNCFLEEINKQYVLTARAKGLDRAARALRPRVPQRHADRDRRLPGGVHRRAVHRRLLIEIIFSLDGLGLLGFEAAINRDYPVMFGTLYIFTLLGLLLKIISDLDLRPGRSADRLRGAESCRGGDAVAAPPERSRAPGHAVALDPIGRAPARQLQGQPPRLRLARALPRPVPASACSPS